LRRWLERAGVSDVPESVSSELDRQRRARRTAEPDATSALSVAITGGVELRRFGDGLHLTGVDRCAFAPHAWALSGDETTTDRLPGWRLTATWTGDGDAVERRLEVRPRSGGERLRPQGRGGSRSVKRLLQEARVLPWRRGAYPLLYCMGRLAIVPNVAVDEAFADVFVTTPRDIDRATATARWLIQLTPQADP
jgi:tRNA(Ile)-lysidine synthase